MNIRGKLVSAFAISGFFWFVACQENEPVSSDEFEVRESRVVKWEKEGRRGVETRFYRGDSHILTEFVVWQEGTPVSKRFELCFRDEVPLIWSIESPGITIIENQDRSTSTVEFTDFGSDGIFDVIGIETGNTKTLFEVYLIQSPWKIKPVSGDLWLKTRARGIDWLFDEGLRSQM